MRGDANQSIGPYTPEDQDVLGRAVLHVRRAGRWIATAVSPPVLAGATFLLIAHRAGPAPRPPQDGGGLVVRHARAALLGAPTLDALLDRVLDAAVELRRAGARGEQDAGEH